MFGDWEIGELIWDSQGLRLGIGAKTGLRLGIGYPLQGPQEPVVHHGYNQLLEMALVSNQV